MRGALDPIEHGYRAELVWADSLSRAMAYRLAARRPTVINVLELGGPLEAVSPEQYCETVLLATASIPVHSLRDEVLRLKQNGRELCSAVWVLGEEADHHADQLSTALLDALSAGGQGSCPPAVLTLSNEPGLAQTDIDDAIWTTSLNGNMFDMCSAGSVCELVSSHRVKTRVIGAGSPDELIQATRFCATGPERESVLFVRPPKGFREGLIGVLKRMHYSAQTKHVDAVVTMFCEENVDAAWLGDDWFGVAFS